MQITKKLENAVRRNNSLVCVGLDKGEFKFDKKIVDQTHDLVMAYKPNSAFYEAQGARGIAQLKMTCDYIRDNYPEIVLILDAKRGDIGSTNAGYLAFVDYLGVDAITLHPYLGREALQPFLDRKNLGCIILCRTSNSGAGEFQDDIYKRIAKNIVSKWNKNDNCLLVVGATYPEELAQVRKLARDMWFLIPGIGAQGGDIEKTVKAGKNSKGEAMIINSSRAIIFAKNPREETMILKNKINEFRVVKP